jgi:hypothetical protein
MIMPRPARANHQVAGLIRLCRERAHDGARDIRERARRCRARRHFKQVIRDRIAIGLGILVEPPVPSHHHDDAKHLVHRAPQSVGDFDDGETGRFVGEQLDDLDALFQSGG